MDVFLSYAHEDADRVRALAENRAGTATSYQLGVVAQLRGDDDKAEEQYHASLAIEEELGNRAGIATSYHQLGVIAQHRGQDDHAEQLYQASLTIREELGDRPGIADSYHQLGRIAEIRGDYDHAEQRYHASLTVKRELGDRAGIASTTSQLGVLRTVRCEPAEAVPYNVSALLTRVAIGSPEAGIDIYWLARQRRELGDKGFRAIVSRLVDAEDVDTILDAIADVDLDEEDGADQP